MEETLGKRIVSNRKRLGITQDRMAEQLGVTAQAVSKWENDQSCPDIAMLPKLADIFGISVDALLTAGWMFAASYLQRDASLWELLWTNALIVFGAFGLFPKFSFFRLGCSLIGVYYLLEKLEAIPVQLGRNLLLPIYLLLFGLSLLAEAIRKPDKSFFSVIHNGKSVTTQGGSFSQTEDTFDVDCIFGEKTYMISLSRLCQGDADVSFGHMTLDLTQVERFTPGCTIDADCSFGELTVLIPRRIRVELDQDAAFGSVEIQGHPDPNAEESIHIDADVSFGQITVTYV